VVKPKTIALGVIVSLSFLVSSCWFLASENKILSNQYVPVTDSLSNDAFIGVWGAKDLTYSVLENLGYTISDSLNLTFNQNGSFVFTGMPRGLIDNGRISKERKLSTESGDWKVVRSYQYPDEFQMEMNFVKGQAFNSGHGFWYSLYHYDGNLTILTYMDDPDMAQVIAFTKKEND